VDEQYQSAVRYGPGHGLDLIREFDVARALGSLPRLAAALARAEL
jgi:hypothetical protein